MENMDDVREASPGGRMIDCRWVTDVPACAPHLTHIGYQPRSTAQFRTDSFPSDNFSVLFQGRGTLLWRGRLWRLEAPCVFRAPYGEAITYGPDHWWEELFLCYGPQQRGLLSELGLWDEQRPVWSAASAPWWPLASWLRTLLDQGGELAAAELRACDAVAQALLLQIAAAATSSAVPSASAAEERSEDALHRIRQTIEDDLSQKVDFRRLAASVPLSLQHFRKRWRDTFGAPPDRWLTARRLIHAEYLVRFTDLQMQEVAAQVGFRDPLHFSRQFHRHVGCSPRECRRAHRRTQEGGEPVP